MFVHASYDDKCESIAVGRLASSNKSVRTSDTDGSMGLGGVDGRGRKGIRGFKERRRDRDNDTDERTMI